MYRKRGLAWTKHIDFILLDLISLMAAILLAVFIRKPDEFLLEFPFTHTGYSGFFISLAAADIIAILLFNPMKNVLKRGYLIEFWETMRNTLIIYAIEAMYLFIIHVGNDYSRIVFFLSAILYFLLTYLSRISYKAWYKKYVIPKSGRSLLVILDEEGITEFDKKVREHYFDCFHMAGTVIRRKKGSKGGKGSFSGLGDPCSSHENIGRHENTSSAEDGKDQFLSVGKGFIPVVSDSEHAAEWVRLNWVDEVMFLTEPDETITDLAKEFSEMGIAVHMSIDFIQKVLPVGKQELEKVGGYNAITVFWNSESFVNSFIKRFFDIVFGIAGCLVTLLLTLVIGPMIWLSSPGPVFYAQDRVGRNGKVFKMYKFRSMYPDADERKQELMEQNRISDGFMFKLDWDPRIIGNKVLADGSKRTGIGEFIRKTSLDEFPQFFNVLIGDMSLIGTRPPTVDEFEKYKNHHRARMAMRPGITGMWQVSGRSNITDFEEVVKLDTEYIANWSLGLDIKILLKTILVVIKHEGSM